MKKEEDSKDEGFFLKGKERLKKTEHPLLRAASAAVSEADSWPLWSSCVISMWIEEEGRER